MTYNMTYSSCFAKYKWWLLALYSSDYVHVMAP